jgi:hypothetical protein
MPHHITQVVYRCIVVKELLKKFFSALLKDVRKHSNSLDLFASSCRFSYTIFFIALEAHKSPPPPVLHHPPRPPFQLRVFNVPRENRYASFRLTKLLPQPPNAQRRCSFETFISVLKEDGISEA